MPKVSVIVPVYNAEPYLEQCVDSVLKQSFADVEIILIDDGSTDGSSGICERLSQENERIHFIFKENGGAATARNAGLDAANGEFILFCDSDDILHPQMLEILYGMLSKSNADIAMCHYDFFDDTYDNPALDITAELEECYMVNCEDILNHFSEHYRRVSLVSLCMKLYRRTVFNGFRIPEGYIEEDSLALPYILERVNYIVKTDRKLYHWRNTPNSVTRAGFNPSRFAFVQVSYANAEFFIRRKNRKQADYFKKEFLQRTLQYYYMIPCGNSEFYDAFKPYMEKYRKCFLRYWFARGLCIRERIAYLLFYIKPQFAQRMYIQVYGDFQS